jgi:hypothetical protein
MAPAGENKELETLQGDAVFGWFSLIHTHRPAAVLAKCIMRPILIIIDPLLMNCVLITARDAIKALPNHDIILEI